MAEYVTKYPKTISFLDVVCGGLKGVVNIEKSSNVEQLHVVVKKNVSELFQMFLQEGFSKVKFEHKQPFQIGNGLSLKLKKPWEMHVRLVELKKELVAIHAEVEISRDYLQHLFGQRTPVIYEIENMLKKYESITEFGIIESKNMSILYLTIIKSNWLLQIYQYLHGNPCCLL